MKTKYLIMLLCLGVGIVILSSALVLLKKEPAPTPSATPTNTQSQKTSYNFHVIAEFITNTQNIVTVSQADAGQTLRVPSGTLIILKFGPGNFHITKDSPNNIFPNSEPEIHLPLNAIGAVRVIHPGSGTITVTETK